MSLYEIRADNFNCLVDYGGQHYGNAARSPNGRHVRNWSHRKRRTYHLPGLNYKTFVHSEMPKWFRDGSFRVGHSLGGVICLLCCRQ